MAMKRANRGHKAVEVESQTVETDADKAAEFDASADAARDPFYAEFTVVAKPIANSPALARFGEAVFFNVTRHRKGAYMASLEISATEENPEGETVSGKLCRKSDVAVRSVIKALASNEREFLFDAGAAESAQAPMPEAAGDNTPQTWFFDEESEISSRLKALEPEIREYDALLASANKNTRGGMLGFGHAYNKAKAIFAEAGLSGEGEGEGAKRGKAAWGIWLRTRFSGSENVAALLESKNAAAQCGFFASAPMEVIEAVGVNTASTFMRKSEEAAADLGRRVASKVMARRVAEGDANAELGADEAREEAEAVLKALETNWAEAFQKWRDEAAKAKEGKAIAGFARAREAAGLTLGRWLVDAAEADFGNSKIGKAIAKAWEAEVAKPSEEEEAEETVKKATAAITARFADMTVEDAANHLLHILVAHEAPRDVLEVLGERLADWLTAQAGKAAAAATKKEEIAANS